MTCAITSPDALLACLRAFRRRVRPGWELAQVHVDHTSGNYAWLEMGASILDCVKFLLRRALLIVLPPALRSHSSSPVILVERPSTLCNLSAVVSA